MATLRPPAIYWSITAQEADVSPDQASAA